MKTIIALILFFAFLGCNRSRVEMAFESLDYSCYFGMFNSLKIYNNGQAYISNCYSFPDRIENFSLKLNKSQLDSLSKMIKVLSNVKLDGMFFAPKTDHPISFALIIKSKEREILTSYEGDLNETEFISLFLLHEYLRHLINTANIKSDTVMTFESKS
jgi:hypothetical protein